MKAKSRDELDQALCLQLRVTAPVIFAGPCVTLEDTRRGYGERRFITLGLLRGRTVVIAHTPRGERTRVISMRKANSREARRYRQRLEAR